MKRLEVMRGWTKRVEVVSEEVGGDERVDEEGGGGEGRWWRY